MTDQMQGRVLDHDHPCKVLAFDALAQRGVRVKRAYTPNPVCSPARASLMTGVLPHTHGTLTVTHAVAEHTCQFQENLPHWAQTLKAEGYHTGYFGKWHVERSESPSKFGWQVDGSLHSELFRNHWETLRADRPPVDVELLAGRLDAPEGYPPSRLYAVIDEPPAKRNVDAVSDLAEHFLQEAFQQDAPWCCFVSCTEPHDPFVVTREQFDAYDPSGIPLPENGGDLSASSPGLYRKAARAYAQLTPGQKREAAACYYASISAVDRRYGRLIEKVDQAGQLDNTIVVLTSDHGELLGAHGLYLKNVGAFEEAYHIPMVLAGPGIACGDDADARVGLHDLGPTLLELCGLPAMDTLGHSRSFADLLRQPTAAAPAFQTGYAEYFGTRYWFTQRVLWDGPWKLVWNGFDQDELYHLERDPGETRNLIVDGLRNGEVRRLMKQAWEIVLRTGDEALARANYPALRLAPYGPRIAGCPGSLS